jgi:hypothetical protein
MLYNDLRPRQYPKLFSIQAEGPGTGAGAACCCPESEADVVELPRRIRTARILIPLLCGLSGCGGGDDDRQPSAEEVQRYTTQIDRAEAAAKAKAVQESQAKEAVRDEAARANVPARNRP